MQNRTQFPNKHPYIVYMYHVWIYSCTGAYIRFSVYSLHRLLLSFASLILPRLNINVKLFTVHRFESVWKWMMRMVPTPNRIGKLNIERRKKRKSNQRRSFRKCSKNVNEILWMAAQNKCVFPGNICSIRIYTDILAHIHFVSEY